MLPKIRIKKLKTKEVKLKFLKDCPICKVFMIEPFCFQKCGHHICINCLKILTIKDNK